MEHQQKITIFTYRAARQTLVHKAKNFRQWIKSDPQNQKQWEKYAHSNRKQMAELRFAERIPNILGGENQ